jgi:hypothetical protein
MPLILPNYHSSVLCLSSFFGASAGQSEMNDFRFYIHPLVPRHSLAILLNQIASYVTLYILHVIQGLHGQSKANILLATRLAAVQMHTNPK